MNPSTGQILTSEAIAKLPPSQQGGFSVDLSDEEAKILQALPSGERMTKLRELRPNHTHNQRKQTLKRNGLRK